ncbi:RHS repeat domain-containing protein [Terrisporobacter vanillatitrophus]|uniref:RHS repeat domain-containing protein n=1 Tax=Terrisporobacter vanillatitrophus TaxID=3058402 RepID=UPI00336685CD
MHSKYNCYAIVFIRDTTITYTYDLNGNQLRESDSITNEVKCYTYDAANRMDNAMFTKAGIVTLNQINTYNGNGQRVEKSENAQSTKYYYQDDSVLYTTGKADTSTELEEPENVEKLTGVTSLNLMGASGNAIATVRDISSNEGEKYYFYNKDMRESTTNLVNVEGKSEVSYEYTDFGETEINGDENFYNEICYTGGIYDNKTGLYYLNARYYNPEDGRFLTEDTYRGEFTDPSSLHLYAYCVNNPISYTDPSGHFPILLAIDAAWGAYDGYQYAKKRNIKGVARAGIIVGYVVVGTINPFKKVKLLKGTKVLRRVANKKKSAKVILKRVNKFNVKSQKQAISAVRKSKKVSKPHANRKLVQEVANRAERKIGYPGRVAGIKKHSYSKKLLDRYQRMYGDRGLRTEISYYGGSIDKKRRKGSSRLDVHDEKRNIVYDYKFVKNPGKGLSKRQRNKIKSQGPIGARILEINPKNKR